MRAPGPKATAASGAQNVSTEAELEGEEIIRKSKYTTCEELESAEEKTESGKRLRVY